MLEYLNYVNDLTDLASITFVHNDIVMRSGSSDKRLSNELCLGDNMGEN